MTDHRECDGVDLVHTIAIRTFDGTVWTTRVTVSRATHVVPPIAAYNERSARQELRRHIAAQTGTAVDLDTIDITILDEHICGPEGGDTGE